VPDYLTTLKRALYSSDPDLQSLALEEIERLNHPYYNFTPRPDSEGDQQTTFVHDRFPGVACLVGGNGSGKDYCSGWKVANFLATTAPPEPVTSFWILSKTMDMVGQDCWQQSMRHWIPEDVIDDIRWYSKAPGWPKTIVLVPSENGNRWALQFKSYDQGRQALQGANIAGFYCSEQCPLPLLREIITRTRKWSYPGSQIYNCTPLEPDVDLETLHNDPPSTWKFYKTDTIAAMEHGHVTKEFLAQITSTELEELISTRLHGSFASFQGLIYRHFKTSKHVIEPFPIPGGFHHCRGLDLGWNDPTFCVWCAKAPDGTWFVYREYCKNQTLIKEHVEEINKGWSYDNPSYGPTWCDHDAQDTAEFTEHGLQNIVPAWKESRNAGIGVLQHMFKQDKIKIFSTCPILIKQLRMYSWNPKKADEPVDKDDHGPDALRYALASDMRQAKTVEKKDAVVRPSPWSNRAPQRNPFNKT
jgi:phage terminase large subunit-like protein